MVELGKRLVSIALVALLCAGVMACGKSKDPMEKIKDLEFSVIPEDKLPEELLSAIEEKKESPFKMTFQDQGFLYICVGYGVQETAGYSITVNALYETGNAIYIDTNLIGPGAEEKGKNTPTYPYIVVKTENLDKSVVFD
ncbi:MAG: protease complex subunit PrcB family protein [Roseburia sp.]|nr:protease complex subunit PrcB family protein [Ruminococcus sp.]MCM1154515.1 protease complex subunit PrcB family protein [Roseburia sp.]MCM1242659.1 protease complex subunit PrcB family protein [Roseburia sp.]